MLKSIEIRQRHRAHRSDDTEKLLLAGALQK